MKKLLPILVVLTLLLTPTIAFAQSANSVYVEWSWQGEKSANFYATPSGLVQAWSYDHPTFGDSHWIMKPYEKFSNATTCDEGYLYMQTNWTPGGIYNSAYAEYKNPYREIFPELDQEYLLCIYPMD